MLSCNKYSLIVVIVTLTDFTTCAKYLFRVRSKLRKHSEDIVASINLGGGNNYAQACACSLAKRQSEILESKLFHVIAPARKSKSKLVVDK